MRYFITLLWSYIILTANVVDARNFPEFGIEKIQEIELKDTLISNFIQEVIIPEIHSLNLDSVKYDLYLSINPLPANNSSSNYFIIVMAEQTGHIPYALNVPSYHYSFFKMKGYIFFCDQKVSKLYSVPTGKTQEFEFDNRDSRPIPENNFGWTYWIVGNLEHPKQLKLRSKGYNIESWEKIRIFWDKFYED